MITSDKQPAGLRARVTPGCSDNDLAEVLEDVAQIIGRPYLARILARAMENETPPDIRKSQRRRLARCLDGIVDDLRAIAGRLRTN